VQRAGAFLLRTVPGWILGTIMLVGVALCFANVVSRYVFGNAIFWAEEILVFLTIWGIFIGTAAAAYDGAHLNMDLFQRAVPGAARAALNLVIALTIIACCVFGAWQSYTVVKLFAAGGQMTVAAQIPKAIPHAALLAGFALTALAVLVRIRAYVSGRF
jgi:TRAP-type C4-dicarboxylate transport system permease small subunit